MPLYTYIDENNPEIEILVLRSIDSRDVEPTLEEALDNSLTEEQHDNAQYKRIITNASLMFKQGKRKGNP